MEKEKLNYQAPTISQRKVVVESFFLGASDVPYPIHETQSTIEITKQEGFDSNEGIFSVNTWNN